MKNDQLVTVQNVTVSGVVHEAGTPLLEMGELTTSNLAYMKRVGALMTVGDIKARDEAKAKAEKEAEAEVEKEKGKEPAKVDKPKK